MDYKALALGLLSAQTKKNAEELASLLEKEDGELKDDALDTLLDMDKKRVASLKTTPEDRKKVFDEGYRKAQGEILGVQDKKIREHFGFDSNLEGVELLDAIVNSKVEFKGGNPEDKTITDDDIRKSKVFIDEQEKWKAQVKEVGEDWQGKWEKRESEIKSKETFGVVSSRAVNIINELNPILSTDPSKADKQKSVILEQLKKYNYDVQDDRIVVLNQDGSVLNDPHENRVEFKDLVSQTTTSFYDLKVADDRDTSGGGGNGKKPLEAITDVAKKYDFKVPKNAQEYMESMKGKTVEERTQITKAWQEVKSASKD